jgi:hypothetical protein
MIDTATSFLAAATFTNANGFWFNGVVSESSNLRDWIGGNLQYFLLRQARIGGKEALKPLVPTNANGTIKTTAVSWAFTFTEEHIIPGGFEIIYTPLSDRKPFCATVLWRQQDDLGIPVMRTAEVRYTGTAIDGPYEQHDLSGFCATENHAVKVGAYIISKRRNVTHRLQLGVKPDAFNPTLAAGDLVRVRLDRIASTGADSVHDYLYEVDRIGKSITGEVQIDLTHFPVDANLASVVAQEVNAATGSGLLLPTGLSGITCDVNSSADTSVPAETFTEDTFPDFGSDISDSGGDRFNGGEGDPTGDNPKDNLRSQSVNSLGRMKRSPIPGGSAGVPPDGICEGAIVTRTLANIGDEGNGIVQTGGAELYSIPLTPPEALGGSDWNGKFIGYTFTCPDGTVQAADPVLNPLPRDGTYDVSGRGAVTVRYIAYETGTRTSCTSGNVADLTGVGGTSATLTGVSAITVEGIDVTVDVNRPCGGLQIYVSIAGAYISVPGAANPFISVFPSLIYIGLVEFIYTLKRDVTVEFADNPGVQVPIENLPRLS